MKKSFSFAFDLISRYIVLIIFGISNAAVFYFLFTSLTIYPVYFLLKLFFDASLTSNVLLIHDISIEIIGACVAGSAYYLLLILNLSTRGIKPGKRILALLFSFFSLLIVNILRIFLLSALLISGTSFFDIAHKLFWYVGSVFFVVLIWFLSVKLFRIKEIPFYSDMVFLSKHSRKKVRKTRRSSKRRLHK
jgi:exosortase/archaeosortase family protein